jgi:hypothetical protein
MRRPAVRIDEGGAGGKSKVIRADNNISAGWSAGGKPLSRRDRL